ncbi:MAG: LysM peptidoglycan-binding domain-containing protein [Chloroflexi bacterium]|nr:LysM peptidoglycan-binding domain-containing protein [Chloroflexota bacterium]
MALMMWGRRNALVSYVPPPRWRRMRRGQGLGRLYRRSDLWRPLVLATVTSGAAFTVWLHQGFPFDYSPAAWQSVFQGIQSRVAAGVIALDLAAWRSSSRQQAAPQRLDWQTPNPPAPEHLAAETVELPELEAAMDHPLRSAAEVVGAAVQMDAPAAGDATSNARPAPAAEAAAVAPSAAPAMVPTAAPTAVPTIAPTVVPAAIPTAPPPRVTAEPAASARSTAPSGASPSEAVPSGQTHVVAAGDTLSSIARRYGATVGAIVQLNRMDDPDKIAAGDRLAIPK